MSDTQELAERTTILRCVVGSTLYGLSVSQHDDRDEMGVCVEPFEHFFGLRPTFEQSTFRTKPEGVRSGPGDLDCVIYSLAKWCRLALGGNPTVLTLLFVPPQFTLIETPTGAALRSLRSAFVGDTIFQPYLGYMRQQRHRMTNKVKMPSRPELVEAYGFDTKYACHLLRLGHQGIELATTGTLTLPMEDGVRQHILDVRRGKVSESDVLAEAEELEARLVALCDSKPLPPPNRERVEQFVIETYMSAAPTTRGQPAAEDGQ